jgi:hypothetical protein
MSTDDDLIPWSEELPPCIDPGTYDAVVLRAKRVDRFGLTTVEFLFRLVTIGPFMDVHLKGYCNLGPTKHAKIRPHSKLASWQRAVTTFTGGTPSCVTLISFRDFWFRVTVATVMRNAKGQLAERDRYSTVTDLIAVVGKITELPTDLTVSQRAMNVETTSTKGYPKFIPGLGPLRPDAVNRCELCSELTPISYGCRSFCRTHAQQQADAGGTV